MRWFFLIPLATGLISGYIAQKSDDEMAYLTSAATVISLFLSLILAPWQVQLLILIVVFIAVRQFWLKLESGMQSAAKEKEPQSDRAMTNQPTASVTEEVEGKLTRKYRGASYEPAVPTESFTEVEKEGKYRGANCKVRSLQPTSVPSPKHKLKYRGINFSSSEADTTQESSNG
jgi:membrane protein implicated in regulation of membrane protease activity